MKNFFSLKDKTLIFPIAMGVILVIIVFSILLVSLMQKTTNIQLGPAPTPTPVAASIERIVPDEPETLTAGVPHTFLVYFNRSVSIQNLTINLTSADITADNPEKIPVAISISQPSSSIVLIKTKEEIEETSEYDLTVTDENGTVLASTSYLSGNLQPTKVPTNDQTLKQFLPYSTNSYTLEYLASQNLYVFHFIYDPTNSEDLQQQFQDAKAQAIQFIQSKGVDINSIVIDFRSS
jgi:hypothetical protein